MFFNITYYFIKTLVTKKGSYLGTIKVVYSGMHINSSLYYFKLLFAIKLLQSFAITNVLYSRHSYLQLIEGTKFTAFSPFLGGGKYLFN